MIDELKLQESLNEKSVNVPKKKRDSMFSKGSTSPGDEEKPKSPRRGRSGSIFGKKKAPRERAKSSVDEGGATAQKIERRKSAAVKPALGLPGSPEKKADEWDKKKAVILSHYTEWKQNEKVR